VVTGFVGTAFQTKLLKGKYKRQEDEEEGISNYWMPRRKRKDPGNLKRKH